MPSRVGCARGIAGVSFFIFIIMLISGITMRAMHNDPDYRASTNSSLFYYDKMKFNDKSDPQFNKSALDHGPLVMCSTNEFYRESDVFAGRDSAFPRG